MDILTVVCSSKRQRVPPSLASSAQSVWFIVYSHQYAPVTRKACTLLAPLAYRMSLLYTVLMNNKKNRLILIHSHQYTAQALKHKGCSLLSPLAPRRSVWYTVHSYQSSHNYVISVFISTAKQRGQCHKPSGDTGHWSNSGSMSGQRRRRWPDIEPTLDRRLVTAVRCDVYSHSLYLKVRCVRAHSHLHDNHKTKRR